MRTKKTKGSYGGLTKPDSKGKQKPRITIAEKFAQATGPFQEYRSFRHDPEIGDFISDDTQHHIQAVVAHEIAHAVNHWNGHTGHGPEWKYSYRLLRREFGLISNKLGVDGMKIGYARVSTGDQNPRLQIDALEEAGCEKIYTDQVSGARTDRVKLQEALEYARKGDCLVVWRLDRLGRSLKHLIEVVEGLEAAGIGFISLQEGFDTTTSGGKLVFQIFGALAEFERNLIRERTRAGLKAARARGKVGGRKLKLSADQVSTLKAMYESKKHTVKDICSVFSISKPTFYRYIE